GCVALASTALVDPAGSPRRQYPAGWSASTSAGAPASSTPSAQLSVCALVLQLPWLTLAAPGLSSGGSCRVSVVALARAGPLLVRAHALGRKGLGEHRQLVEGPLEGIEALPQVADIAGAAAPAERARRRGARRRAVDVQAQRGAVEGAHHVRPAAGRKGRSLDRD